jgi:hypothetical protein
MPEKHHDLRRELVTYLHFLVGPPERVVPCDGCTPYRRLSYAALGLAANHAALCTLPCPGYTWWRSVCLTQPYPQPRLPFIGHSTQSPALSRLLQQLPKMCGLQWLRTDLLVSEDEHLIPQQSSQYAAPEFPLQAPKKTPGQGTFLKLHSRGLNNRVFHLLQYRTDCTGHYRVPTSVTVTATKFDTMGSITRLQSTVAVPAVSATRS